jgi:hypothetical protein
MKAILELEIPKNCLVCKLGNFVETTESLYIRTITLYCSMIGQKCSPTIDRLPDCLLKPVE